MQPVEREQNAARFSASLYFIISSTALALGITSGAAVA